MSFNEGAILLFRTLFCNRDPASIRTDRNYVRLGIFHKSKIKLKSNLTPLSESNSTLKTSVFWSRHLEKPEHQLRDK